MKNKDIRAFTVCFTGHRELRHKDIPGRLDTLLAELIKRGYRFFGTGGALGFDTEAAWAVLRARKAYSHIKLIIVSPYPAQDERWNREQQEQYRNIIAQADKVRYTGERYTSDCYHIRNRRLVDGAGLCVAYMYKSTGGTAYTINYAQERGVRVINIAEGDGYHKENL